MRIDTTKLRDHRIYRRFTAALELLFLALTGVYLFYQTCKITTLGVTWPSGFSKKLLAVMAVVAVLRLLTTKLVRWKTLAALGLAAVYMLVYRSDKYRFLQYMAVLTVGLIDIDYRKILKTYLLSTGVLYCAAVFSGMTGASTNYVYTSSGRGLRSAWGICYPTDFATKALFLLLALWVAWRKLPDWAMLLPCAGFIWMARVIAFSWNGTICGVAFLCAILYCMFERRVIDQHPKLGCAGRGTNLVGTAAFPLFALAMFALMLIYAKGTNAGYRLDGLLSGRLELAVQAWQKHGLHAFGKRFSQYGNGFSTISPSNYNFVDSSYPLILLRYGWVMLITLALTWGWTARRAIRCGDRRLLLTLGLIAFHSFVEHHFTECEYNILLVMPLAAYTTAEAGETAKVDGPRGRVILAHALAVAVSCGALWLIAPAALSGLRTVLEYKGLCGASGTGWKLLGIFGGLLAFLVFAVWALDRLLKALLTRRRITLPAIALALCACAGVGGWIYSNHAIDAAAAENAELIEADREALEIAVKAATGRVYSGILPSAYRRQIGGISCSVFTEDDLARNLGDTFLLPNKKERAVFLNSGSLYVEISKKHALYSGDRAVIEALTAAGYHATGYYSTTRKVSLSKAALYNGLSYDKETGLKLSGKKRSMTGGPYYDLYAGKYTVTYELTLPEDAPRDDSIVCTLSITAEVGKKTLLEKEITGDQFDENGILSVGIPFSIGNTKSVAFCAKGEKGKKVFIKSLGFVKTPDSDTHRYYDGKFRVVREEYYDLNGDPMIQTAGHTSFEQEYDGYGNMISRRFYDGNNRLVLRTDGYAEVRWEYNAKRQVIRESFYDTQGKPVMISSRQAANEREYDENGNVVVWRYLDTDGKPVVTTSNYAELRREYNKKKQVVREEYIGADGEPLIQTSGYSGMEQDYDDAGNVIARRFFDPNGPVLRTDGYAEVRWQYNGLKQIVREDFYGTNGEPVMCFNGYAADEREYDAAGNVTVYRYYNEAGEPTNLTPGYSELRREYNDRRWIIREEYFDTSGQLTLLSDGYASLERDYNEQGAIKAQRHYGLAGEPVIIKDGYFEVRRAYDDAGHVIQETYYDGQGALTECVNGYAEMHRIYSDESMISEEAFFTAEGIPAVIGAGYTRIIYEYTEDRQLSLTYYLDLNGNSVHAGSGYLHEYLMSLMGRNLTIFISVKDEAVNSMTPLLFQDLEMLGIRTDLKGRVRNSYYAVISSNEVIEEIAAQARLTHEGMIGEVPYSITSAGFQVGNYSSIIIDGIEYSKNGRGLNIVVYDNEACSVIDSVVFDTYVQEMTVRR